MKITAYEVRPDEEPVIRNLCEKYGIDVVITRAILTILQLTLLKEVMESLL